MRVLLDENMNRRLKRAFDSNFAVMTGDYPCGSLTKRRSRPRYRASVGFSRRLERAVGACQPWLEGV